MDQQVNVDKQFAVSAITPWIKGTMDVDDHNIKIDIPNTILFGLIPAGKRKFTTPLMNVSNVYTSTSYKVGKLAFGLLFAVVGFGQFKSSFELAVFLLFLAVVNFTSGIVTVFQYQNSGSNVLINLPFFEAAHCQAFEAEVISKLDAFHDDRNMRIQNQTIVNAQETSTASIIDAINNQKQ